MTITWLTLLINIILLLQFSHLSLIAGLRIKRGKNGLTPFLLLVSLSLTGLVLLDIAYQITILTGVMGDTGIMQGLQGVELIIRTVLLASNTVYFIAIRQEAFAPLKRMTRTREAIFRTLEDVE